MSHIHSWRRFKNSTFICAGATCYVKLKLEFLHKKLANCPKCNSHFLIDITRISNSVGQLCCAKCREDNYTEITLEEQRNILTNLLKNEFEAAMEVSSKQLARKRKELERKEAGITEARQKLAAKIEELRKRKELLEKEYKQKKEDLKGKPKEIPPKEETEVSFAIETAMKKIMEGE